MVVTRSRLAALGGTSHNLVTGTKPAQLFRVKNTKFARALHMKKLCWFRAGYLGPGPGARIRGGYPVPVNRVGTEGAPTASVGEPKV